MPDKTAMPTAWRSQLRMPGDFSVSHSSPNRVRFWHRGGSIPSMVFISHSSKDRPTADAICAHLESAGIKSWIAPRDIDPGTSWTQGIMQGLEACRVFILVFSEHANDSDHVQREVAKAFSSGLAVIPFRIKDVFPNQSLSYFLDTVQWLDASAPPLQKHLGTLC